MRLVVTAQGNEAGSNKGIEIYDLTNASQMCEVTWNGNALQNSLTASWVGGTQLSGDIVLVARVKGSSATEDITIYSFEFQEAN